MKSLDIIDSASFGYMTVWAERRYLAKLAVVPVMIKLVCAVVVFALGYEANFLRQGLVSLPAAFAEGWLLAQFLRTLLLHERWPIYLLEEPSDQQMSALLLRARGIMSATIMYALITLAAYGIKEIYAWFYAIAENAGKTGADGNMTDGNPWMFIPALAMIYFSIWIFRMLWLYIPVVVLMPVRDFLSQIKGFVVSLKMMAIFLVSMVPCFLLAVLLSNVLASAVGGFETDQGRFIVVVINVLVETVVNLIATAAMVYAFRHILPKHPKALPDLKK